MQPIFVSRNAIGQMSLMRRAVGRREDGTANTTTHSAIIASPMNSNTNASTAAIPQQTARFVRKPLTVS
jgi:hypothetical protein